ncbi:hypothetical protein D3C84_347070 [compost metagenome]
MRGTGADGLAFEALRTLFGQQHRASGRDFPQTSVVFALTFLDGTLDTQFGTAVVLGNGHVLEHTHEELHRFPAEGCQSTPIEGTRTCGVEHRHQFVGIPAFFQRVDHEFSVTTLVEAGFRTVNEEHTLTRRTPRLVRQEETFRRVVFEPRFVHVDEFVLDLGHDNRVMETISVLFEQFRTSHTDLRIGLERLWRQGRYEHLSKTCQSTYATTEAHVHLHWDLIWTRFYTRNLRIVHQLLGNNAFDVANLHRTDLIVDAIMERLDQSDPVEQQIAKRGVHGGLAVRNHGRSDLQVVARVEQRCHGHGVLNGNPLIACRSRNVDLSGLTTVANRVQIPRYNVTFAQLRFRNRACEGFLIPYNRESTDDPVFPAIGTGLQCLNVKIKLLHGVFSGGSSVKRLLTRL